MGGDGKPLGASPQRHAVIHRPDPRFQRSDAAALTASRRRTQTHAGAPAWPARTVSAGRAARDARIEHGSSAQAAVPASTASPCMASRRSGGLGRRATPIRPRPKAAALTHGVLGTFDSLNPFIVKGLAPAADPRLRGREPDGARLRRAVHALRPARAHRSKPTPSAATSPSSSIRRRSFSDGKPVTADDVIFSWQLLRDKGRPNFRTYYAKVAKAEAIVRAHRALRSDRRRRPRAAADPRPDAGAGQARRSIRTRSRTPRSSRSSAAAPM